MKVLVVGHRLGLARALEKMKISYLVWTKNPVVNALHAEKIIIADYPLRIEEFNRHCDGVSEITHIIAGVESSVIPSSLIREWLKIERLSHDVILHCTDKLQMKEWLTDFKIPMTNFDSGEGQSYSSLKERLKLPFICKPKRDSGGRGINFIKTNEDFNRFQDPECYYETFIKGREGSIESFIENGEIIFNNMTEYHKVGACNKVPAHFNFDQKKEILSLNEEVIKALSIKKGMTHLEYYLTDNGIIFGEIALRPPGGYLMEALSLAYNYDFWELLARVELGLETPRDLGQVFHASSLIIHPGEGEVRRITGVDQIKKLNSLIKIKVKISVGDKISQRGGVGEDCGYALMKNTDQKQLSQDIESFYRLLEIEIDN